MTSAETRVFQSLCTFPLFFSFPLFIANTVDTKTNAIMSALIIIMLGNSGTVGEGIGVGEPVAVGLGEVGNPEIANAFISGYLS